MQKKPIEYQLVSMTLEEKIESIRNIPLFSDLEKDKLQAIAELSKEKNFSEHEVFIEQFAKSDAAYFIVSGSARIHRLTEDGHDITLAVVGPGDLVGEMALLDQEPRSASAETLQNTTMLTLSSQDFSTVLRTNPEIAIKLLAFLSRRIRTADERYEAISTENVITRTLKTLVVLQQYFPDGQITLSHEELATVIGATRARVTEALNTLLKEKRIEINHRNIHII